MSNGEKALTAQQAADLLNIHVKTAHSLLKSGELVGRQIGRDWRIHPSAIDEFLLRRKPPKKEEGRGSKSRSA